MAESIRVFLSPKQVKELREIGEKGDQRWLLLKEAGGDEAVAELLAQLRGVDGVPPKERPLVEGSSLRVAAQKNAARRQW